MDFYSLARSFEPFQDTSGDVLIQVRVEGETTLQQLFIDSPQALAIVTAEICQNLKAGYPSRTQVLTFLDILRGIAFRKPRQHARPSHASVFERQPLAQAVLGIAKAGGTRKPLPQLLASLVREAQRQRLDLSRGPTWPNSEDSLGKQLSSLITPLAALGVTLTRHDTDRPRTWSIASIDEERDASDEQVTDGTPERLDPSAVSDTSLEDDTTLSYDDATRPGTLFAVPPRTGDVDTDDDDDDEARSQAGFDNRDADPMDEVNPNNLVLMKGECA